MERSGNVLAKINAFRRKYYLHLFLGGLVLSLAVIVSYILLVAVLEYALWLPGWIRFVIVSFFLLTVGFCFYRFLAAPIKFWILKKGISEEESAGIIGSKAPGISDKLVNLVQLMHFSRHNALALASIDQRSNQFQTIEFETLIEWRENLKYLKYLLLPLGIALIALLYEPGILTDSTKRILNFSTSYSPAPPFQFEILAPEGAIYNEDYSIQVNISGKAIPDEVYLLRNGKRFKMSATAAGFNYTIENVLTPFEFQLEAAGFYSEKRNVDLINRPELNNFIIEQSFPSYLRRKPEVLTNPGDIEVPEGTTLTWKLNAKFADSVRFRFETDQVSLERIDNELFTTEKKVSASFEYGISLYNSKIRPSESVQYAVTVVKDQFPTIRLSQYRDSILFQNVLLSGIAADDYGISKLNLVYKVEGGQPQSTTNVKHIPVGSGIQQSFFYQWKLDSLDLKPGQTIEYFLELWDNDGINGRKSTRSSTYSLKLPTKEELDSQIGKAENNAKNEFGAALEKAAKIQDEIENAAQQLKGKQSTEWRDNQMIQTILQQKQELDNLLKKMNTDHKKLMDRRNTFTEQDDRIARKAKELQRLLDEMLDDDTKKMLEEINKLMKENSDMNQIQRLMENSNRNSKNLEKELARAIEEIKNLNYESRLERLSENLKTLAEKQSELAEKTAATEQQKKDKSDSKSALDEKLNDLAKEQSELTEEMQRLSNEMDELKAEGEELKRGEEVPSEEAEQSVTDEMQKSKEELDKKQPAKAQPHQKKSQQSLEQMSQGIDNNLESAEMELELGNLEMLRHIVHGLVTVSYKQETLLSEFNKLANSDPRFNSLAQQQLKLKDDVKVLEDSLLALGKRDPFMGSVVGKEITELNSHLENANEANRDRKRPQALTEMQASMTSLNNLALLLDNHFDAMMQMMNESKPGKGKGGKGKKPSLSELQKQLNGKIEQLKNSGKSGRQLSEELAEMAAEQEQIRNAMEQLEQELSEKNGKNGQGNDISDKMEQSESDLVNKRLTEDLIKRQQQILTRLLESEKAQREQDQDNERKGESAKDYKKEFPKEFQEYLLLKEKEVELLKTLPPKLYPYYRKEVSDYFKRLSSGPNL